MRFANSRISLSHGFLHSLARNQVGLVAALRKIPLHGEPAYRHPAEPPSDPAEIAELTQVHFSMDSEFQPN